MTTTTEWTWGGARWWKCDLHTHTPASDDYGKGPDQEDLQSRSPKEWLLDHMRAGLDCVAVTDHNTGEWIDPLKDALAELREERPDGFRPLYLFPGVEISVHGGVHVLAIFGADQTTSGIDSLLGAVGFPPGSKGSSDAVTTENFSEVANKIDSAGGLAIPAHVDQLNGLFKCFTGTTLGQALGCQDVFAVELMDRSSEKPSLYLESSGQRTEILGSDSHHPVGDTGQRFPGSHFTWVKMGSPGVEGLRLALLDGPLSVRRSDTNPDDPNQHGPLVLESIEVRDAHYMGQAEPFTLRLNPWLNAVVGGRGTGKSSVIEFARLALRREEELPEELSEEFAKYRSLYPRDGEAGLLRPHTHIRVVYRKDGSRFRVQWTPGGDFDPIEEEKEGEWARAEGNIRQRFPVRMFSQKQIFHLAREPLALLKVVDEATEVDRRSWAERISELEAQFLSLRAKARELEAGLAEEPRLRGELDDVKRKLAIFEDAGHADVLKEFQRRRRQERAVEVWEESWSGMAERLRRTAQDLLPEDIDETSFDLESEPDAALHEAAAAASDRVREIGEQIRALADQAAEVFTEWRSTKEDSTWKQRVEAAEEAYRDLGERLAEEGAGDPTAYRELVQRRQTIERRLKDLVGRKERVAELLKQASDCLERLAELRRGLTEARRDFLASVLEGNPFVRIDVVPYGAQDIVEDEFRTRIQKEDGTFEKDIGTPAGEGLLGELYEHEEPDRIEEALSRIKRRIRDIARDRYDPNNLRDNRFATHLSKLPPEAVDRLDLWFPEDSLEVRYSPTGDGRNLRSIEEGSPGQKTAALLAFLLSYGEEPLILDQPEDDLDNHLIYELIVTQLRQVKRHRQIVVVTHNPNIVVNGDAELVVALVARGGETQKECEGSLQEESVRDTICDVMEGGREAFDQRYRRIALGGHPVR